MSIKTAPRVSALVAHRLVVTGAAKLVCAYDDPEKCRKYHIPEALSLKQAHELPKERDLIFYCA